MQPIDIAAPAKINLYLDVVGKRPDGYHELITLMCCVGVYDTVRLRFDTPGIRLACDHPGVPDDDTNTAHRAAARFFHAAGISPGVDIRIDKKIPIGAGLGGGSSDAAAVLTGLNRRFGNPLSYDVLKEIAKGIGADVPFFINGKPAVATGIGDVLTPFDRLKSYPVILIYPGLAVSTAEVYKKLNLGLTKNDKMNTKNIFKLDWEGDAPKQLFNALESVAFRLSPQSEDAKIKLLSNNAAGALMSGSGSTVYGIFSDEKKADRAYRNLMSNRQWLIFYTRLLT